MRNMLSKVSPRAVTRFLGVLVVLLLGAASSMSAQAVGPSTVNKLLFIANDQLFSSLSNSTSVQAATALPSGSAMTGLYRSLATDGTYLYFSDGTNLVRTNLDGTAKVTIVAGVTTPEQIVVLGNYLYYSRFSFGIYSVAKSGGSPTRILSNSANYGWDGLAATGASLYAANYQDGLYIAQLDGSGGITGTPAINSDADIKSFTKLLASGTTLYAASNVTSKIWKTEDPSLARSLWGSIDILGATYNNPSAMAIAGDMLYFTTGSSQVGQVPVNGGASAERLSSTSQFASAYGIVAIPQYSVTYSAGSASGVTGSVPVDSSSPYIQGSSYTVLGNTGNLTRPNYQFYVWREGGGSARSPGASYPISADTVLTADWVGGPLIFSLTPGGSAITTAAFPNTVVGSSSTLDIYVRNSGAAVSVNSGGTTPASLSVDPSTTTCATPGGSTVYAAGSECRMTMKWSPNAVGPIGTAYRSLFYGLTNQIDFTGTAVQASRTPTFDTPVKTADGFTVNVTNWDNSWTWSPSVSSGTVVAGTASGSTLPLTVTGLSSGSSATVTVSTSRSGYANGDGIVLGAALSSALSPTFDTPVQTTDGFTVNVTNWDPSWTWYATVGAGTVTVGTGTGSTLPITVTGLPAGTSVLLTVTNSRSGYIAGSASVTSSAATHATPSGGTLPLTGTNSLFAGSVAALLVIASGLAFSLRRRQKA